MGSKKPEESWNQEFAKDELAPRLQEYSDQYGRGQGLWEGTLLATEDANVRASQDNLLRMLPELRQQIGGVTGGLQGFLDYDPNSPQNVASRNALGRNVEKAFNRSIRPGIENRSTFSGQYGGPQSGLALGMATEGLSDALVGGEVDLMNADRNRGLQALQLAPGLLDTNLLPSQIQGAIGQQRTGRLQQQVFDHVQQYEAPRMNRYQTMQEYASLIGGGGYGGGGPAGMSVAQGALGGAATGASVGGVPGAVIGGVAGGVLAAI